MNTFHQYWISIPELFSNPLFKDSQLEKRHKYLVETTPSLSFDIIASLQKQVSEMMSYSCFTSIFDIQNESKKYRKMVETASKYASSIYANFFDNFAKMCENMSFITKNLKDEAIINQLFEQKIIEYPYPYSRNTLLKLSKSSSS